MSAGPCVEELRRSVADHPDRQTDGGPGDLGDPRGHSRPIDLGRRLRPAARCPLTPAGRLPDGRVPRRQRGPDRYSPPANADPGPSSPGHQCARGGGSGHPSSQERCPPTEGGVSRCLVWKPPGRGPAPVLGLGSAAPIGSRSPAPPKGPYPRRRPRRGTRNVSSPIPMTCTPCSPGNWRRAPTTALCCEPATGRPPLRHTRGWRIDFSHAHHWEPHPCPILRLAALVLIHRTATLTVDRHRAPSRASDA